MIRIGDFSKLSRVSVKALRFYDEMDLLKPAFVDPFTGYRLYRIDQLPQVNRILVLKDLGFSLDEIRRLLAGDLSDEQMRGMLKLRQAEIRQRVQEETRRLERIEARLRQMQQEDRMSNYDVVVKPVEPMLVASIRATVPTPPEQGGLWGELMGALENQGVRTSESDTCLTLYFDEEYRESDWDVEVCQAVRAGVRETGRMKVYPLPGVETMACVVHHGPFDRISEAYNAIGQWIDASGYRICGPAREVTLHAVMLPNGMADQSSPETVVEVQFPVEKG